MYQFDSKNEEDTIKLAEEFAKQLKRNDIVVLSGDLGSGKTKFTQGILKYFGVEKEISSPTFTIVNEYNTNHFSIYHFDLYRLANIEEFYAMGGDEYFQKDGLCILEWGERIEQILNKNYYKITFLRTGDVDPDSRTILIETF